LQTGKQVYPGQQNNGEKVCQSFYGTSILWSKTLVTDAKKPAARLEDFKADSDPEA
jgi:hypothetical protein